MKTYNSGQALAEFKVAVDIWTAHMNADDKKAAAEYLKTVTVIYENLNHRP